MKISYWKLEVANFHEVAKKITKRIFRTNLNIYTIIISYVDFPFISSLNLNLNLNFWCFTPLSAIFQLYHGDQYKWWKNPEYPERTTDHGQATGKLYHLRLRVECTLFCNLQSRARTHAILVIGLYELLGNPTT
jgi:hypothetical protein